MRILAFVIALGIGIAQLQGQLIAVRGTDNAGWVKDGEAAWSSIGGTLAGGPDVCQSGKDTFIVARGSDGAVWMNHRSSSSWSGWSSLGGTASSDVSVVCTGGGARVFVRGTDQAVWTRSTSADDWTSLDGEVAGTPEASVGPSGKIDVVVRGMDGAVWHRGWNGTSWSPWRSLGGRTASDPTIARLDADRAEIIVTNADGTLQQGTLVGSGAVSWRPLPGGVVRGSSDLASSGDGRAVLVARGTDDAVWKSTWDGSGWAPWSSLGGISNGDPGAAAGGGGKIADAGSPPAPRSAEFVLEMVGFAVERQTVDHILNLDGWGDEVYFVPANFSFARDGSMTLQHGVTTGTFGQATTTQDQAGSAQANGGLRTGDSYPADVQRGPVPGALSGLYYGRLTEGTGGEVILPTIWEWDGQRELLGPYFDGLSARRSEVAARAGAILASLHGTNPTNFIRDGSELGLGAVLRWPGNPGAADYPIGVVRTNEGMTFTPKAIFLTYEVADFISSRRQDIMLIRPLDEARTTAAAISQLGEPGVFTVEFRDEGGGFQGDYTLYFRLRRYP